MSKQTGVFRRLGLALVLAIGFGAASALATSWAISIWESLHTSRSPWDSLVVCADGTPLIQRYTTYDDYRQVVTYHDLDSGREVPNPKEHESWLTGASLAVPRRNVGFPLDGNARIGFFSDGQTPPNLWYFVHDGARDGRGYFVGYDSESKLCVGFIGRDGFRTDRPPVEQWFPMDGVKLASGRAFSRYTLGRYWGGYSEDQFAEFPAWKVDMISGTQLIEVDLRARSVTTLMESTNMMAVGISETVSKSKPVGEEPPAVHRQQHLAVRTADRVLVLDAAGKQHSEYVLPEEDGLRDRGFTLYELDAGKALVIAGRVLLERSQREELLWIDASGKVLRRAKVSRQGVNGPNDARDAWKSALIVPAPVALALVATLAPLDYISSGREPNYSAALAHSLAVFWPSLLVVTLLSAVLAWYCCRRHRRYYQASSVVWFVFVLLLGVSGLVAYLFHRRWPVLEKCPACGHDVPRDREACAKCGAAFPPPEPKDCEVFA
jgi:hypothetical protein